PVREQRLDPRPLRISQRHTRTNDRLIQTKLPSPSPHSALGQWISLFADFLVTKHGLAAVLQADNASFEALHAYFLDRLVPVCAELLEAAAVAGEIRPDIDAYQLMRGVGNLCIGADGDPRYDARRMVELLVAGLSRPHR
ncbi:hypothetical protein AB0948_27895, partial [Streptomyces koyangensis]